jgi:hypothetical protein
MDEYGTGNDLGSFNLSILSCLGIYNLEIGLLNLFKHFWSRSRVGGFAIQQLSPRNKFSNPINLVTSKFSNLIADAIKGPM